MKKTKFIQDAKRNPTRFYTKPSDVIRDRRLDDGDRLDILRAWELEAVTENSGDDQLEQLRRIQQEILHGRENPS